MAKIRIKTDMVDIKLANVKPDEFTGAWKWVLDVIDTMNASKDKAIKKETDDTSFDIDLFMTESFIIINIAQNVIRDMYSDIVKELPLHVAQRYDVCGSGKQRFDRICDELVETDMKYPPIEAAKLTGKICSEFFSCWQ